MTRQTTNKLIELVEDGLLDKDYLIRACLSYMSEDDVADMARHNEIIDSDDEDHSDD